MPKRKSRYNRSKTKAKDFKDFREFFEKYGERSDVKEQLTDIIESTSHRQSNQVKIQPRSRNQRDFVNQLFDINNHIILGIGPAGTGKTLLATKFAIKQLMAEKIEKIVITRPAVSVDEQHGYLPGSLEKKMEPWVLPILDVFQEHYTKSQIEGLMNSGQLEIAPLAYMRGRTFKNSVILADEMQNATPSQVKMILTRIGENSKMIVTGDLEQHDRGFEKNGLKDFVQRADSDQDSTGIKIVRFTGKDIQRHTVIDTVLNLYNED